jgi:hypothetical protein
MKTESNQGAPAREIPTPPGGGSWTFDEVKSAWVSNDTASVEQASPAAAGDTDTTETNQEQGA